MISAPSLRLRLNGSKWLIFGFLSGLVFWTCSSTRTGMDDGRNRDTESDISANEDSRVLPRLDTIEWKVIAEEKEKPITGEILYGPGIIKKEEYNLSLFMPFESERALNTLGEFDRSLNDNRFLNFYAGAILALKQLESEGLSLNIKVFDTNRDPDVYSNQLNSFENRQCDLIVGPYDREAVRIGAEWALSNRIPMISPWQASNRITEDNPYYIQLRPNLDKHYEKMVSHALQNFETDQIIFLGRLDNPSDQSRIDQIQKMAGTVESDTLNKLFQEFYVHADSLIQSSDSLFHEVLLGDRPTCFIIPNWRFDEEDFIYGLMRKLNVDKGFKEVYVYGMPILLDSEKISYDLYRNLNVRICRSKFVDYDQKEVHEFDKKYFEEFGAIPTRDAFEGYDVLLLAGRSLHKYGLNFQYYLDQELSSFLQSSYQIEKTYRQDALIIDRFSEINYFENWHLDIIEYDNERFKRTK